MREWLELARRAVVALEGIRAALETHAPADESAAPDLEVA